MARIEWAQLCELAFLDSHERLCMIGVTTRLPVPSLPIALCQLMIAARVVDAGTGETLTIGVSMTRPNRVSAAPDQSEGFDVVIAGEYVLITLWNIPFAEAGVYRFSVFLGEQDPVALEVKIALVAKSLLAQIPGADKASNVFEQATSNLRREVN